MCVRRGRRYDGICRRAALRVRLIGRRSGSLGRSSEVGADLGPALAAVGSFQDVLSAEIERARILRRKNQRRHLRHTIFRAAYENVHDLSGGFVPAQDAAVPASGINDAGVGGIGSNVTEFEAADGKPIAETDFAVVAAMGNRSGAAILLRSVGNVGKLIVRDDVIELAGRLIIPTAPGKAGVEANGGALVHAENHAL